MSILRFGYISELKHVYSETRFSPSTIERMHEEMRIFSFGYSPTSSLVQKQNRSLKKHSKSLLDLLEVKIAKEVERELNEGEFNKDEEL